jgi:hypothetical protein
VPELEQRLREVRPVWPEPSAAAEARARAALGFASGGRSPGAWRVRVRRGPRLLAAAALLVAAGATATAALVGVTGSGPARAERASLDFGPVQRVGGPVSYFGGAPDIAVDGRGTATVVWSRAGRVVASTRPKDGQWSAPERISDPRVRATLPQVAADRAGNVIVVWKERTAGERVTERFRLPSGRPAGELVEVVGQRWGVVSRVRPVGGAWQPAERLTPDVAAVRDIEQPQLGMGLDGTTVLAWDAGGAMYARVRPAGGAWQDPVRLGAGATEVADPRLVVAPSGRAIAVWSARDAAGGLRTYRVTTSTLEPGGKWSTPRELGEPTRNAPHALGAVNDRGDAVVGWSPGRFGGRNAVFAVVRGAGSDWSEAERLSRTPTFGVPALVGIDRTGRAVLMPFSGAPTAVTRRPGGTWTPVALRRGRFVGSGAMIADASGGTLMAIGNFDTARQTRVTALDGGVAELTGVGSFLTLAAGADGTAAVAWVAAAGQRRSSVVAAVAEPRR